MLQWDAAVTACNNRNTSTPITGATWQLPSKEQWEAMIAAAASFTALLNGFTAVGGTNMNSAVGSGYWSSTATNDASAWGFYSSNGTWEVWIKSGENAEAYVRAALAW